jgi:hypothetical protein
MTAVEWLVNEIAEKYNFRFATYYGQEIQQANAMFEQQIIDAYKQGQHDSEPIRETDAEQYYEQKFNK